MKSFKKIVLAGMALFLAGMIVDHVIPPVKATEASVNAPVRSPNRETVENSLWVYPGQAVRQHSHHIVLLVHGMDNTGMAAWSWSYAAQLAKDDLIPATITLPHRNTADLCWSGKFVSDSLEILHQRYPNAKISIVAHSMGNMATAWAMHFRPKLIFQIVDSYVAIGAPFHGGPVAPDKQHTPAAFQVAAHSNFVKAINQTPFPTGVRYLSIISKTDEISTPDKVQQLAAFPAGTPGQVVTPQDVLKKPNQQISHVGELGDGGIYEMARAFLTQTPINQQAAAQQYYPALEIEGLQMTEKYGTLPAHAGDAVADTEPMIEDTIIR